MKATKRSQGIGIHQRSSLKDANDNFISKKEIVRVAEKFHTDLYRGQEGQEDGDEENDSLKLKSSQRS